jgi:hypothetical protein
MAIGHEHINIPPPSQFHFVVGVMSKMLQSFDVVILCLVFLLLLLSGGRRGVYKLTQVPSAFHYANEPCVNCVRVFILSFSFFNKIKGTGSQRSVAWTLQQSVRVQCGSNYLTAALPRNMAEALGVIGLFLNDRGCAGKRNATHWMVRTHVTSCGSTSRIDGKLTTYSNAVHLKKLLKLPFCPLDYHR